MSETHARLAIVGERPRSLLAKNESLRQRIRLRRTAPVVLLLAFTAAACGSDTPDGAKQNGDTSQLADSAGNGGVAKDGTTATTTAAPSAKDGTAIAKDLKTKIGSVQQVITITEDNDPNNLIGRPTGYLSGAVLYDSRVQCTKLGVDCGATIEIWPSAAAAKTRADYIEGLQKGAPILGTEYHYLRGTALLRVSGDLKPTAAKEYESAFLG